MVQNGRCRRFKQMDGSENGGILVRGVSSVSLGQVRIKSHTVVR